MLNLSESLVDAVAERLHNAAQRQMTLRLRLVADDQLDVSGVGA
jgi:hypothetical protein